MKFKDREKDILRQLATGKKIPDIAEGLKLSEQTIRNHVRELKRVLEADTLSALVYEACKQSII